MNTKILVTALAIGPTILLAAPVAFASCGSPDAIQVALHQASPSKLALDARIARAVKAATRGPSAQARSLSPGKAIVGMWRFTFFSQGNLNLGIPDGAVIDAGYQTWHADGTEITNSLRPPKTQSFCTGVWDYASGAYSLNHYALSWSPDGSTFVGPANLREQVGVDASGNAQHGRFSIDQYDAGGAVLLVHLDGIIDATRVTVH